ncbi:WD40-repeat-containing [Desulfonema limicola]|uniref:WD40-repeat-containing n=1 Tax=Desulfonema limicola TaxID=45656 RepID=A0A975B3F9_9BACT|nr:caspase family protein [Desulfonema limicola]QTA78066.1 WD40-repeat-containing [Desulfonema limicola]
MKPPSILIILLTALAFTGCTAQTGQKPGHAAGSLVGQALAKQIQKPDKPAPDERAIKRKNKTTAPPILSIDTGGHMAKICDVIFTKDGKYLVSASNDKTIRIWNVETGGIERIIRGQMGEGHEGKIFAAALSPDNRWLAVGGWMKGEDGNHKIRLIDFHTGKVIRLLKGHENVILALSFSPDSRRLISGSADTTARIWDVSTGTALHTLSGHTERIYAAAFSPDGRLAVTGSDDDTLILWNAGKEPATFQKLSTLTGHTDKVKSAAFTPDGRYLLSGSWDKTIRLWDGKTGEFIKVMARQDTTVDSLTVTPDGKRVLTGSGDGLAATSCNIFSIPDGKNLTSFTQHKNIVLATAVSPDGRLAATGGGNDQEIYLWDIGSGRVRQKLAGKGKIVWSVGFGRDGRSVAWGQTWRQEKLFGYGELEQSFRLSESSQGFSLGLGETLTSDSGYIRGIESAGSISIRTPDGKINPTLQILENGKVKHEITRGSTDGNSHRSLTLTPDGRTAVSGGSNGFLTSYDTATGTKLHDFIGHTGDVWGVAVSPDGRMLVSGSDDQTVKLWDIATGRNLLTIFHASDNEWVAWTPQGYYDCSLKGDQYIGWHLNQGEDRSALYYPASQFAEQFRNPFLTAAYVETNGDLDKAVALAESRQPRKHKIEKTEITEIINLLPPEVFFKTPGSDTETKESTICIEAGAESLTHEPVTDIWLTLNGKQLRGIVRINKQSSDPDKKLSGKTASIRQCLPLDPGNNQIAVFASTKTGTSQPAILKIERKSAPAQTQEDIYKPDIYVLAIGVSKYANPAYNLNVAHKDAEAIAQTFSAQEGRLYRKAQIKLLTNQNATADNILDGLDWILKESTQKDVSVIFLAGHGENDDASNYYFIPHDGDVKSLRRTSVKWFDFQDVVSRLPSKTLMMVDTCRSGNITGTRRRGAGDLTEALRELIQASPGLIVMTASTGRESSIEKPEWGHGAFTKALVEGLRDFKADSNQNGSLEIMELNNYVTDRVKQLTKGAQHTTTEIPKIMPNFPIAVK